MMFSRMAPTVLFTAFCVALTGAYIADERQSLSHPAAVDPAYIKAVTAFSDELALAIQVGDQDRYRALLDSQATAMTKPNGVANFKPDTLPAPYNKLRKTLMHGDISDLIAFLEAHPDASLNTPVGHYQSVPLFWATMNYHNTHDMIETLLAAGADPTFRTSRGYTLLHAMSTPWAVLQDEATVDSILAKLPSEALTYRTDTGATAFQFALSNRQVALALALLERGADANERSPIDAGDALLANEPPLILAESNVELVEALLFASADPLARAADGTRVLDYVTRAAADAETQWQERQSASEAEEWDRRHAADYARVRDMIRAAADGRLAKDR